MDKIAGEIWLNATIALARCAGEGKLPAIAPAAAVSASALASAPAIGDASLMAKIDAVNVGLAVGAMLLL
jgi:hypothetical protein